MLSFPEELARAGRAFASHADETTGKKKKPQADTGEGRSHKVSDRRRDPSPSDPSGSSSGSSSDESSKSEETPPKGGKRKSRLGKLPSAKIARIAERVAEAFRSRQKHLRKEKDDSQADKSTGENATSTMKAGAANIADASNRSIIVDEHDNWIYATAEDITNPVGGYIIPLVNNAWQRGTMMDPFKLNPVVSERFSDWCDYAKRLETHLKLKGDVSQWQRGLYVASALGPVISGLVNRKKWIANRPIEGCKHFNIVMEKLNGYFKQFANPSTAHESFMNAAQGHNESIMDFYERVLKLAEVCGLSDKSILVKNTLIKGLRDKVLKELVTCQPFTVQAILSAGLAKESQAHADKQSKPNIPRQVMAVEDRPSTSNAGESKKGKRGKKAPGNKSSKPAFTGGPSQDKNWSSSSREQRIACNLCGSFHAPGTCFAASKTCYTCGQVGHLARCCPSKKKDSVNEVKTNEKEQSSQ